MSLLDHIEAGKTRHYTGFSSTGIERFRVHSFANNLTPKEAKLTMIKTDGLLNLVGEQSLYHYSQFVANPPITGVEQNSGRLEYRRIQDALRRDCFFYLLSK